MQGRQYKASNVLTMKFDEGFADESDNMFVVNIDYYDYGGGGYFNVEYLPRGQEEPVKLAVLKQGDGSGGTFEYPGGKWWRVSMLIEDANFTGKLPGGADIRIYTSAWNAFAKVEVLNISKNTDNVKYAGVICESRIAVPDMPLSYNLTGAKNIVTPKALMQPARSKCKKFFIFKRTVIFCRR
jgi:hypothetical protein